MAGEWVAAAAAEESANMSPKDASNRIQVLPKDAETKKGSEVLPSLGRTLQHFHIVDK